MELSQHIAQQEQELRKAIQAATEAGGNRDQMEHLYGLLKTTLEALEITDPRTLGVISTGYLSAFADTGPDWDGHIERAKGALKAIGRMIGDFGHTLKTVIDEFDYMRRNNPAAARLFGFGLTRLHPNTVALAEAAV